MTAYRSPRLSRPSQAEQPLYIGERDFDVNVSDLNPSSGFWLKPPAIFIEFPPDPKFTADALPRAMRIAGLLPTAPNLAEL
jgi:hypothetical protein